MTGNDEVSYAQVGASNELPESEELDALYDRFLIRRRVGQVSAAGLSSLLTGSQGSRSAATPSPATANGSGAAAALDNIALPEEEMLSIRSAPLTMASHMLGQCSPCCAVTVIVWSWSMSRCWHALMCLEWRDISCRLCKAYIRR
jgi:hypothetical protein